MMIRGNAILLIVFALAVSAIAQDGVPAQPHDLPNAPTPVFDLSRSHQLMHDGNYREALRALKEVEVHSPEASGLAHDLGVVYYHLGNFVDAVPALHRAFAESADDHEAEQLLGMSF